MTADLAIRCIGVHDVDLQRAVHALLSLVLSAHADPCWRGVRDSFVASRGDVLRRALLDALHEADALHEGIRQHHVELMRELQEQ